MLATYQPRVTFPLVVGPALVMATLQGDDVILCQITSEARVDAYSVLLTVNDFVVGSLQQSSMIRPNRIFTADKSIILYKVGTLKEQKVKEVEEVLMKIFKS